MVMQCLGLSRLSERVLGSLLGVSVRVPSGGSGFLLHYKDVQVMLTDDSIFLVVGQSLGFV